MKKIVKLTESDMVKLVKKVVSEQQPFKPKPGVAGYGDSPLPPECSERKYNEILDYIQMGYPFKIETISNEKEHVLWKPERGQSCGAKKSKLFRIL